VSRDGSGVYSKPGGTTAVSGAAISSSAYNTFCDDVVADLNAARPITAGGTGATSASAARTNLGVSATDATITAIAALDFSVAGSMLYSTGADTFSLLTTTVAGRALLDDADAAAQRATLGLGSAALVNTGTSGATAALNNGANTWSASQTISVANLGLLLSHATNPYWQVTNTTGSVQLFGQSLSTGARFGTLTNHNLEILTNSSTAATIYSDGGLVIGSPTGGNKGAGTVNAVAVYDDNSLLTCYIIEAWKYGAIDLAKWDALVLNREHPATYETVETGELDADDKPVTERRVVTEAYTEVREHAPARGFARVAADRLDIDKFAQFVWDNERLPAFPAPDRWQEMYSGKMATGDLIQRLWETVEVMAVHSIEARKRELSLIARVEALEAAL